MRLQEKLAKIAINPPRPSLSICGKLKTRVRRSRFRHRSWRPSTGVRPDRDLRRRRAPPVISARPRRACRDISDWAALIGQCVTRLRASSRWVRRRPPSYAPYIATHLYRPHGILRRPTARGARQLGETPIQDNKRTPRRDISTCDRLLYRLRIPIDGVASAAFSEFGRLAPNLRLLTIAPGRSLAGFVSILLARVFHRAIAIDPFLLAISRAPYLRDISARKGWLDWGDFVRVARRLAHP